MFYGGDDDDESDDIDRIENDDQTDNELLFDEGIDDGFKSNDQQQSSAVSFKMSKQTIKPSTKTNDNHQSTSNNNNNNQLLDALCEYVEVYLHCILYKTKCYKKEYFEKFQKYGIIVYKCKNEIVSSYIEKCVECLRLLLEANLNQTIAFAVLDHNDHLIKRFTIKFKNLFEDKSSTKLELASIEFKLRDSILKLLYSNINKYESPKYKWQIQMKTNKTKLVDRINENDNELFKIFSWRMCDKSEYSIDKCKIKPIKTCESNSLKIHTFIETKQC